MGKSITIFDLFIRKNTNDLRTNTDDATFSINIPISKKFQTKMSPPPHSNSGFVPTHYHLSLYI